jgi:hypothetical protein
VAIAPEAIEAGEASEASASAPAAAAPRRQRSSGGDWGRTAAAAWSRVPGSPSSNSTAAQTIVKLAWAVAVGLIVLEIAARATGQVWSLSLPAPQGTHPTKGAYLPLYPGQSLPTAAAMPGFFGAVPVQSPDTNLSGRAGGTQAAP